jgi:hypothetical protein
VFVVPGDDTVIEEVGGHQGVLTIIELDKGHLAVGIDEGLLVDSANALEGADVVGVLGARYPGCSFRSRRGSFSSWLFQGSHLLPVRTSFPGQPGFSA